MSKILDTEEFARMIAEFTAKTGKDVITEVAEIGDDYGMSVSVDEGFMGVFGLKHPECDFEQTLNDFMREAIKSVMEDAETLQ